MKDLIISNYDSGCCFSAKVLNDDKVEKEFDRPSELYEFGLYSDDWGLFDTSNLNSENQKIKQFDRIIICEDGQIEIYVKGELIL